MKFKVGQMVKAKGDQWFNKGESLKIVKVDRLNETYRCKGTDETWWQDESGLEPLVSFQEKLDRFMKEPVGFLVKSKEIADELAKVFERKHMKARSGCSIKRFMDEVIEELMEYHGKPYVTYGIRDDDKLSYGAGNSMDQAFRPREFLNVTLDELKEYLESAPQTLEDKLELFKAGTHVLHTPTQEIYDKLMVELEKRGLALVANEPLEAAKGRWRFYGKDTCVRYAHDGQYYGRKGVYVGRGKEIIELTLEDFRMGNAHRVSDSEQEDHMKITIETDGHHKTTAECNGITAESLCNPMDEFKLPKGVHMAVQRLLERLEEPEEDTGFHVGDIVEVVANEFDFSGNPIGLQGVVECSYEGGAGVKLPIRDDSLTFYDRELKLIRRGNN